MSLEGKTIARVIDLDYNGQALVFTDGTAAQFEGIGWEADGCSVKTLTSAALEQLEAELAERRKQDAITRERNIARREQKERIKRNVSAHAWLNWQRVHVSPMESLIDSTHLQMVSDMNRQLWSQASVPIAKTTARRT
jgi:Fe-S cluster biosynthesis and repair protein YggX